MPNKVYTIEWVSGRDQLVIAVFSKMKDRDETWRRIKSIPMQDFRKEFLANVPIMQRVVSIGCGDRDEIADGAIEYLRKSDYELLHGPCEVADVTSKHLDA